MASLDWGVDVRYQLLRSRTNELAETFSLSSPAQTVHWSLATRLNHVGTFAKEAGYRAGFSYSPFSWLSLNTRLVHKARLADPSSSTTGLASVRLQGHVPSFLSYFLELGLYQRRHRVGSTTFLPQLVNPSFTEWDVAFAFGLGVHLSDDWALQIAGATLENFDVYNLNHPYAEAASISKHSFGELSAYIRYQFLLGFGLSDAWIVGLSLNIKELP